MARVLRAPAVSRDPQFRRIPRIPTRAAWAMSLRTRVVAGTAARSTRRTKSPPRTLGGIWVVFLSTPHRWGSGTPACTKTPPGPGATTAPRAACARASTTTARAYAGSFARRTLTTSVLSAALFPGPGARSAGVSAKSAATRSRTSAARARPVTSAPPWVSAERLHRTQVAREVCASL